MLEPVFHLRSGKIARAQQVVLEIQESAIEVEPVFYNIIRSLVFQKIEEYILGTTIKAVLLIVAE